jgi:putative ABC transport system substrate-binding protein
MKRCEFITLLGGATVAWPLGARAQQPERMRRIGVLLTLGESDPEVKASLTAFQEGLQQLGWAQGRNVWIDYRSASGDQERLKTYAGELLKMAPDVLFCQGVLALLALHQQTRALPIVANLARPGGNVTGFTNFEHAIGGKWLELIKDTVPGVTRVEVILDPDTPLQSPYVQAIEAAAPSFGVELVLAGVRNAADIERAINAFAPTKGALIVLPSFVTHRVRRVRCQTDRIRESGCDHSARTRAPQIAFRPSWLGWRATRQAYGEHRPFAGLALDGHIATHHARELARDSEPKPGAAVAPRGRSIGLGEFLE